MNLYKGYYIHVPTSGGKAGKGYNLTTTIQVRKDNVIVNKFKVDSGRQLSGIIKARQWVDEQFKPIKENG